MNRLLYTLCFYLLLPVIFWRLYRKGNKNPDYRQRWPERLGHTPFKMEHCIWIHSVSLGESIAATPFIKRLIADHPNEQFVITTTTPTGSAHIQKQFGTLDNVYHCYFPYDLPHCLKRFCNRIQPKLFIIMETELWPNLLKLCQHRKIPSLLANARLSERAMQRYARFRGLSKEMMQRLTSIAAQTQMDADHFIQLGAEPNKITVTGNIKFDLKVPTDLKEKAGTLIQELADRPVWVAASTHNGEEHDVLTAHQAVLKQIPNALLILVPRHPERFDFVADSIQDAGLHNVRRSSKNPVSAKAQVLLGDTMGEMMMFYSLCDTAFVGGSLVPVGGHNLLEPAALEKATITGPHVHNFKVITELLFEAQATKLVKNAQELGATVTELLQDPDQSKAMGKAGLSVVKQNQGAIERLCDLVNSQLN